MISHGSLLLLALAKHLANLKGLEARLLDFNFVLLIIELDDLFQWGIGGLGRVNVRCKYV